MVLLSMTRRKGLVVVMVNSGEVCPECGTTMGPEHDRYTKCPSFARAQVRDDDETRLADEQREDDLVDEVVERMDEADDVVAQIIANAGGAGGGSGGCDNAGGGGAGGARTITGVPVAPGPYTIVVGAGGAAPLSSNGNPDNGENGTPSYFGSPITSAGGGGGAGGAGGQVGGGAAAGQVGGGGAAVQPDLVKKVDTVTKRARPAQVTV